MTSVTQTIPTLTGGLSQQPDELKIPGQVNVANNVIPDVTHGLLKRPGGKLVKSLSDSSSTGFNSVENGRWFSYYRDETESYIGQISRTGDISVWDCATGNNMIVKHNTPTTSTLTFNNIPYSTQSGTGGGYTNPINLTSHANLTALVTAITGKVYIGSTDGTGSKVVATNITNPAGLFVNNVELELAYLTPNTRLGFPNNATGPASGTSGTCTLTITINVSSYLIHNNDEDIQTLTLNDFTFITNRTKTTAMSSTVETVRPPEVFIDLKATAYCKTICSKFI